MLSRRQFLAASAVLLNSSLTRAAQLPPVRAITKGPKFHWFGYYDKLQFDPTSRYCLGMEVTFEHRSPTADDPVLLGMIDLHDGDKWTPLGRSTAWNWQQGCMLQWRPGSKTEVLWNDRLDGRFVCRILDVKTQVEKVVPHPVYAVSPDGKTAVAPDFRRLADTRPGYGYAGIPDPFAETNAPDQAGITHLDLTTGVSKLILPFAQAAGLKPKPNMAGAKHWFNHCLFNPTGSRFVFLHRWRSAGMQTWQTRMLTADPDGSNLRVVDDNGMTSHFIWRDEGHILAWSDHPPLGKKFYLFADDGKTPPQVVGPDAMLVDGHCTYLPGNKWILCDTYPDKDRNQNPYLFEVATGKKVPLGHFPSPKEYTGEWRCDTHPRFSPDGRTAVIDSPHNGGRQMYAIDLRGVVG